MNGKEEGRAILYQNRLSPPWFMSCKNGIPKIANPVNIWNKILLLNNFASWFAIVMM